MRIDKAYNWLLGIALIIITIFIGIVASVPPVCRDSLTHHLYVPKLYLKAGAIYEIPHITFSYYPQLLELLYIIPLYFENDIIPKYIHFSFAIATSFLLYSYLKEKIDKTFGLMASLIFLTIPVIVKLSVTVYVDLGLIFFTFASIIYLFKWANSGLNCRYLIFAGVFTGLGMGTKYNGIITLILLTTLLPLLTIEHINQQSKSSEVLITKNLNELKAKKNKIDIKVFLYPAIFASTALLVFSPWMLRNYLWTANPLYPLYKNKIELSKNIEASKNIIEKQEIEQNSTLKSDNNISTNQFLIRKIVYHEKWWETLLIPIRIFFQGEDDNPALFDGKLNPFLFIVPLFFILISLINNVNKNRAKNFIDREILFLMIFSTTYLILVFFKTDMRIRYISPIVPPLVIIYATSLYKLREFQIFKWEVFLISYIIPIILCLTIFYNVLYLKALFLQVDPFDYISGKDSKSQYINKFRPEYEIIEYINKTAHQNSKILALFLGDRGYYFEHEVRFDKELLFSAIKAGINGKDIAANLKKSGFTHLIICFDLFYSSLHNNLKSEEQIKMRDFFENEAILIKNNNFYGLYQLQNYLRKVEDES